jgi:rubredoxin
MTPSRLTISLCHANCPKCGLPTEFRMFESGAGGDFATYIGARTGAPYRLDLGKVHYQGASLTKLLAPALEREGSLMKLPDEVRCKLCGNVFSAVSIPIDGEEVADTYEL